MSAVKRTCLCCGKKFKYCPNCGGRSEGYNFNFDTQECAELFNAVSGYNMGVTNANAINNVLIRHNVEDFNKYDESISSVLFELFPKMSKTAKKEEAPVVTDEEKEPDNPNSSLKHRFSKKNKSYQTKEVDLSDKTNKEVEANTGISEDE